jgi:hypothetical protein
MWTFRQMGDQRIPRQELKWSPAWRRKEDRPRRIRCEDVTELKREIQEDARDGNLARSAPKRGKPQSGRRVFRQ